MLHTILPRLIERFSSFEDFSFLPAVIGDGRTDEMESRVEEDGESEAGAESQNNFSEKINILEAKIKCLKEEYVVFSSSSASLIVLLLLCWGDHRTSTHKESLAKAAELVAAISYQLHSQENLNIELRNELDKKNKE